MKRFVVAAVAISISCATAQRPANVPQPEVFVQQATQLFFGSGNFAPLNLDVTVRNPAAVPLIVQSIQVSSPGMMQYAVAPMQRIFNQSIAPGETRTFPIHATAVARASRLSPSEPLTLRTEIRFKANGHHFRELFNFHLQP